MSLLTTVSGYVQVRPYGELDSDRYQFITLDQTEPNPGLPDSDGAIFTSNADGTRGFTTKPRLSDLAFKSGSLDQLDPPTVPTYFLVFKNEPGTGAANGLDDSVAWSLGEFEEIDTLQTVTERGNTTTEDVTVANFFADSGVFSGGLTIEGNLIVNGTETIINSTTLTVDDKNIVIAQGAPDAATANGGGITLEGANATMTYNASDDQWEFNKGIQAVALSEFDSAKIEVLDVEDLFLGGRFVFDSASDQVIEKPFGSLSIQSSILKVQDAAGTDEFATFQLNDIRLNEILYVSDSANLQGKVFLTDVPEKEDGTRILFRRTTDGLVMEGEIETESIGKVNTKNTNEDEIFYPVFTPANAGAGGVDSALIDALDLTYNAFDNLLNVRNIDVSGIAELDSTNVAGDLQIKTTASSGGTDTGRLLDSAGRSFVVYDSAGNLLWGNNGVSAGNLGGPQAAQVFLSGLGDVDLLAPVVSGQVLKYDGVNWTNGTDLTGGGGGGGIALTDLSAVTLSPGTPSLSYNELTGVFSYTPSALATTLLGLTDVTGDGTNGQVLATNGAGSFSFVDQTGGGGVTTLPGLTDVTLTNAQNGEVLKYNGSEWVNGTDLTATSAVEVQDEGSSLTTGVTLINFVGAGVTATNSGTDVTVTIDGGGGGGVNDTMASITDTSIVSATDGDILRYFSSNQTWRNVSLSPNYSSIAEQPATNKSLFENIWQNASTVLTVTANGSSAYRFDQYSTTDNPTIYVKAGTTIGFDLSYDGGGSHPFKIQTSGGADVSEGILEVTDGNAYTDFTQGGAYGGTLYWKVPASFTGNYKYQCTVHGGMTGTIVVEAAAGGGGGGGASNVFATVASTAQSNIEASGSTDTLNIEGGTNIDVVTTPGTNTLTVNYSGASPGATLTRTTEAEGTSVGPGANANLLFGDLGKAYSLFSVAVDEPSRIRIYSDIASRDADETRPASQDPAEGAGVIAEFIATTATTFKLTPAVLGWIDNSETNIPVIVTNTGASTRTITVTLTGLVMET
jgi:plastocyanin